MAGVRDVVGRTTRMRVVKVDVVVETDFMAMGMSVLVLELAT